MFDKSIAIIDVETTGMSARLNRIIEIAIIRVEGSKIIDSFSSFINPQISIPSFITHLTGITNSHVENAPHFGILKNKIRKYLKGATFVAHNAWFDYSFIQNEFARIDSLFESKRCCSVQLSRRLFPQHKSHSLANIIERYGFEYKARHRAYDDAFVVWQLLRKIKREIPRPLVKSTWDLIAKL